MSDNFTTWHYINLVHIIVISITNSGFFFFFFWLQWGLTLSHPCPLLAELQLQDSITNICYLAYGTIFLLTLQFLPVIQILQNVFSLISRLVVFGISCLWKKTLFGTFVCMCSCPIYIDQSILSSRRPSFFNVMGNWIWKIRNVHMFFSTLRSQQLARNVLNCICF